MMHRLFAMLRVGRVKLIDDSGPVRLLQADEGDLSSYGGRRIIDKVRHISHYGLISLPPLEAEILLASPQGDRSQTLAIGSNHQPSRPKDRSPGDAGLYDVRGQILIFTETGLSIDAAGLDVVIKNAGNVTITASTKVTIDAPNAEFTGDVTASGTITALSGGASVELGALRDAYNAHKHGDVKSGNDTSGGTDHAV